MARISIDFDVNDAQAVAGVNRVKGAIGSVQPPHPAAAQGFTSLEERILGATGAAQKLSRTLVSLQFIMGAVVAAAGIKQIIEAADAWTLMAGRLRVVTENASEVARIQHELVTLSVDTRTSLEATAQLYTRLALNTQALNLSESTLLVLTKAVSQATLISGATTEEASGAIIQFTQAVALGHFRMQELNSVMMGMPRLSQAMIDGLMLTNTEFRKQVESGKSAVSVLRSWTEQGKLTAEIFLPALITQIAKLNEEAARVPTTSGQAFEQLKNQLSEIVGQTDITPLVKSLQDLAYTLTDPSVQAAILSFTNAMVQLTAVAVTAVAPALDAINLAIRGLIINQLLWIALVDDFAHGASWSQLKARYQEITENASLAQDSAKRLWDSMTNPDGDPTRSMKELEKATKDAARAELALLDAEKLRNRPGAPDDAARIAAAKRLEEEMKLRQLMRSIILDQSQFEMDQSVKTTDFVMHENKRKYDNYEQSEADFIATELALLQERNDQELKFLDESRANVVANLGDRIKAIKAHAADKKNLEDPGLTAIKITEANQRALKAIQDLDQKGRDSTRKTEQDKIKVIGDAEDRITKMVAEASGARSQREIDDIDAALKRVERGSNAEIALHAQKYQKLSSQYDADVNAFIAGELLKTGMLEDENVKRLAQEAGLLKKKQEFARQIIDNAADLATEQARLAGNIDLAYSVGFAEAAVKADDAFTVMRKAGAETFVALKSGLSDFLFDMFTGAKSIGDVFVNLGKRILRSMTDAFAEILAKQIAMAAGFSLTGLLGIGTAVAGGASADVIEQARVTALANEELGIFTDTVATSTDSLTGFTGVLGLVVRTLMFFANGLMGVIGFFGGIIKNIAAGVGIVDSITSAFSGLVSAGGVLSTVFGGISTVGGSIMNAFQGVGSMAEVFQSAFDALDLTSGGFGVAGGMGLVGESGQQVTTGTYAQFLGEWIPIAGALYAAALTIQDFFAGRLEKAIGATIGTAIGAYVGSIIPGIGTITGAVIGNFIGGFIGGLFASSPEATLKAKIAPFDRNAISSTVINGPGPNGHVPGQFPGLGWATQVGAAIADVGGDVLKSTKEDALQLVLAAALNDLLQRVVNATILTMKTLPPTIGAQLDAALTAIETNGLIIEDWSHKGKRAGKRLQQQVEGFMDDALQAMVVGLNFGNVDLKALGFDPKDPKGEKGGEVARGFNAMMLALGGLSAIVKEVGPGVDLAGISLAQFTRGAIDLFKSFATEGEAFTDTIKRVMATFGEIIALKTQIHTALAAISGDITEVVGIITRQMANAEASMVALVDALTVAIESGAKPEEVLAAAKAATDAVLATLKMETDAVTGLHDAVLKLNTAITGGVDLIASLTQKIDTLRGANVDTAFLQTSMNGIVWLFNALTDVNARISLFASGLVLLSESADGILGNIPLVVQGFNIIMDQIQHMANPTEAIAALKGLAGAVESGLQAGIAGINRQTQATIAGLNAQRAAIGQANAAQKSALEQHKTLINENFNAQKTALQVALDLSRQWASVLQSVKAQLVDLFNLLAPTHPLTSLNEVRAQFDAAFAAFQAHPTAEGATGVQDLAKQLLQLAQQTPGYDLPSAAFQGLAASVKTALEAIQTFAASQPSQEAIQAQIAALETQQVASLANIDTQIQALDASQAAALAAIDQAIQQANLDGQAQIQQLQNLAALGLEAIRAQLVIEVTALAAQQAQAAAALQAVLGDKTFEQFIAEKQQVEPANLLRGIDHTLQSYLGAIITNLFPGVGVPQLAGGMDYVPSNRFPAYLDRGERVLTASENRAYSGASGGGSHTVTITLAPTIQITGGGSSSRMKDELDRALVEIVNGPSLTRPALLALAKRAS